MGDCAGSVQLCALRVAKLASTGAPDPGAENLYVTDTMMSLEVDPEVSDGEDIEEKNGCGKIIVDYRSPDAYRRLNVSLVLAVPNPELVALLTGHGQLLTKDGSTVGFDYPALFDAFPEDGVSIEGWSKAIVDGVLAGTNPYWRWVLPKVKNFRLGTRTLEDGSSQTTLEGHGYGNAQWGDGPVNDWDSIADEDIAGPLAFARDATIPEASCEYQELVAS